jgi:hypothetical protein
MLFVPIFTNGGGLPSPNRYYIGASTKEDPMSGKDAKQSSMERAEILERLFQVKSELALAYRAFNAESSPEMVESNIYKINSLQATFTYCLRQAKAAGCTADVPIAFRIGGAKPETGP